MKKLASVLALMFAGMIGCFALDLGDIKGTWQDSNWDANWTFSADGNIVLTLASTGETVFTFTDSNTTNFKLVPGTDGVTVTFDCAETERSYSFNKPISLNADLNMKINPEWSEEDYETVIKFQR